MPTYQPNLPTKVMTMEKLWFEAKAASYARRLAHVMWRRLLQALFCSQMASGAHANVVHIETSRFLLTKLAGVCVDTVLRLLETLKPRKWYLSMAFNNKPEAASAITSQALQSGQINRHVIALWFSEFKAVLPLVYGAMHSRSNA